MKILLTIHGMGDPYEYSSVRWAEKLLENQARLCNEVDGTHVYKITRNGEEIFVFGFNSVLSFRIPFLRTKGKESVRSSGPTQ